jgi:hypothetical protein
MSALRLLEVELRNLERRLNRDQVDANDVLADLLRRFGQVIAEINTTPPQDIGDCRIKIARLADPVHGIEAGIDDPADTLALRQVAEFLGQVEAITVRG